LRVPSLSGARIQVPAKTRPAMGAQCTSAAPTGDGSFVATSGEVVGTRDYPRAGPRLNVACNSGDAGAGAPVLDEFGSLVGIAGVDTQPVAAQRSYRMGEMMTQASPGPVLPIDLVHTEAAASTPLSELKARGLFILPITLPNQILSAGFATSVIRDGARTQPVDQRDHFSLSDKRIAMFVTWDVKRPL